MGEHKTVQLFGRRMRLPRTRIARTTVGVLLIIGGILGFLPVLGFWMIPLGLLVLSDDFAPVRRWRRRMTVRFFGPKRNARAGKAKGGQ